MTTATDSGIKNISSIFVGNVGLKVGTWTAGATGTGTAVTISGGGTAVIAAGVNIATGANDTTAKLPLVSYSFVDGNPNVTLTPKLKADTGTYWMITKLS